MRQLGTLCLVHFHSFQTTYLHKKMLVALSRIQTRIVG